MAGRINRKAIIHIILIGTLLTVVFLISFSLNKDQNNQDKVAVLRVVNEYLNYDTPLTGLINISILNPRKLGIRVEKLKYKLTLSYNSIDIKSYPVVFGFNPIDDKLREGDGCTPEGVFKVRSKYHHASWSRFIWIDYPNEESWRKHRDAKQSGRMPYNYNIDSEVGIHGVPQGCDYLIDSRKNWTLGSVSLKNKDIIELYPFITSEILIEIVQ